MTVNSGGVGLIGYHISDEFTCVTVNSGRVGLTECLIMDDIAQDKLFGLHTVLPNRVIRIHGLRHI